CALPPEHHSTANAGPDGASDEIASEQMANRVEPCNDGEVKRTQIEQHHGAEYYRNELPHFPILSPTPSVAPAKPRKLAAVCLTRPGQGCSREQHQHHSHTNYKLRSHKTPDTAASREIVACETLNVRATSACA